MANSKRSRKNRPSRNDGLSGRSVVPLPTPSNTSSTSASAVSPAPGKALETPSHPDADSMRPAQQPEPQMKQWERVIWMFALIGGIHAAYTTWMSGWIYINGRRDIILGIGQPHPLGKELAHHVFWNDWVTCILSFGIYAVLLLGTFWLLVSRYRPIQVALLNPFEAETDPHIFDKRCRRLTRFVKWGVIAGLVLLVIVIACDWWGTRKLMAKYCLELDESATKTAAAPLCINRLLDRAGRESHTGMNSSVVATAKVNTISTTAASAPTRSVP